MSTIILSPQATVVKAITVETSKGTSVPNEQTCEISNYDKKQLIDLEKRYIGINKRTAISPNYNCHGMTFASRRTNIYASETVAMIIEDDKYEEIGIDSIEAGDVVLYYDEGTNEICHSGTIVRPDKTLLNGTLVCSKWGKGPEFVHAMYNTPYGLNLHFFRCKL